MDDAIKGTLLWLWISVAAVIGVGLLWIASATTFWVFPPLVDPPDLATVLGGLARVGIWSIVSAIWTGISILGWKRFEKQAESWFKDNRVDY